MKQTILSSLICGITLCLQSFAQASTSNVLVCEPAGRLSQSYLEGTRYIIDFDRKSIQRIGDIAKFQELIQPSRRVTWAISKNKFMTGNQSPRYSLVAQGSEGAFPAEARLSHKNDFGNSQLQVRIQGNEKQYLFIYVCE